MSPLEIRDALRAKRALIKDKFTQLSEFSYDMNTLGKHLNYCRNLIGCNENDWNKYLVYRLTPSTDEG